MTISIIEQEHELLFKSLETLLPKLNNKSILITGANGLIGSYLIAFLDFLNNKHNCNISILAMSRSKEKLEKCFENKKIEIIEQDLNIPIKQKINADFIIHAASNSHPVAFATDPVGTMKTNLIGTMELLDLARNNKSKFLYISTGEIYGNNINDVAFTEEDLGLVDTKISRSCYPESKRAAETLCMSYKEQYDVDVNVARLCYVYGATITDTNSRADAQFLRNVLDGQNIVLKSKGLQRRTYCYVADCISALLYILLDGINGEVYNISNPNSIASVYEYAETLADVGNVNVVFDLPSEIEIKGFSKQADSILNSDKLQALGWQPHYTLKSGLTNTINIKKGVVYA